MTIDLGRGHPRATFQVVDGWVFKLSNPGSLRVGSLKHPSEISGFPTSRSGVSKLLFLSQEILYLKVSHY